MSDEQTQAGMKQDKLLFRLRPTRPDNCGTIRIEVQSKESGRNDTVEVVGRLVVVKQPSKP